MNRITAYKLEITDYLDMMYDMVSGCACYIKQQKMWTKLVFKDQMPIDQRAGKATALMRESRGFCRVLRKRKTRLKANVNFDLVMELLFLTIKEN